MVKQHSEERAPFSLFHAAVEREKEDAAKQHHVDMIKQGQVNIFELDHKKQMEEANQMKEQALTKLRGEMANSANNAYVQVIGDFLVQHIEADPTYAEKLTVANKTIAESLDVMVKEARKKEQSGVAVLTDVEGFAIVLKYFGIDAPATSTTQPLAPTQSAAVAPAMQQVEQVPVEQGKPKKRFDASMAEFW